MISKPHALELATLRAWLLILWHEPAFVVTKLEHPFKNKLLSTCRYKPDALKTTRVEHKWFCSAPLAAGNRSLAVKGFRGPFTHLCGNSWSQNSGLFYRLLPSSGWAGKQAAGGAAVEMQPARKQRRPRSGRVPPAPARGQGRGMFLPPTQQLILDSEPLKSPAVCGQCTWLVVRVVKTDPPWGWMGSCGVQQDSPAGQRGDTRAPLLCWSKGRGKPENRSARGTANSPSAFPLPVCSCSTSGNCYKNSLT